MYRVLVVEDEDIIRKGLMFLADWEGVNCVVVGEATDGKEGLEKIEELRPDIVITDVKMPIKNGIEMLEESLKQYQYEAIIISGYGEFEYAQRAMSIGVTEYLLKPLEYEQLYCAIRKITDRLAGCVKLEEYKKKLKLDSVMDDVIINESKSSNKYVALLMQYIQVNYASHISLTELSQKCNLSCTYLNTKYKQETGYTFNDFLNRYRILKAVELLKQGKLKVYEISEQVGFSDYKYFIKVFKKYIGYSPAKFISPTNQSFVSLCTANDAKD